jgi:hypothetical protein
MYDCCINSCVCYTGRWRDHRTCPNPKCRQPRYNSRGKPRRQFAYLPLTPRLQAFFANNKKAREMLYRGTDFEYDPDVVKDVFDGTHYRSFLGKNVHPVDGQPRTHQYFEDARDVALGLSTDGYAPFKRRTKTAWPLLVFNYNLPPDVRFLPENILCVGVIPGPNKPWDFDSFLVPLVQEMLALELGVTTWDSLKEEHFQMFAFLILAFGDMPAVSTIMSMKGHNAICPCRFCKIRGIRIPQSSNIIHYIPLDRSTHPNAQGADDIRVYDPLNLPMRSHSEFLSQAVAVDAARAGGKSDDLAKEYGIKGRPVLSYLSTLSFPFSFPYDFMHLLWENVIKLLFQLWSKKKTFGDNSEDYHVSKADWDEAGRLSKASGATIPYAFGPSPPNIASDTVSWTADTRSFWTCFVGPSVLDGRLPATYFDHYIDLVKLVNICLEFDMKRSKLSVLRAGFASWVQQYERYVPPPFIYLV